MVSKEFILRAIQKRMVWKTHYVPVSQSTTTDKETGKTEPDAYMTVISRPETPLPQQQNNDSRSFWIKLSELDKDDFSANHAQQVWSAVAKEADVRQRPRL